MLLYGSRSLHGQGVVIGLADITDQGTKLGTLRQHTVNVFAENLFGFGGLMMSIGDVATLERTAEDDHACTSCPASLATWTAGACWPV